MDMSVEYTVMIMISKHQAHERDEMSSNGIPSSSLAKESTQDKQ